MKSKIIEEFIENYASKSTQRVYCSHLTKFFEILQKDPDTYFDENKDPKEYEDDVKLVAREISGRPPMSQKGIMSAINVFLNENDVELKQKIWRGINRRRNGSHPITIEKIPTTQDLKTILQYGDVKSRALFLLVAVSGMRIDETLKITLDNIDLKSRTITVIYDTAKGGRARTTFFTKEAKEALEEWIKRRKKFMKIGYKKSKYLRDELTKKGYVFEKKTSGTAIKWIIKKNGRVVSDSKLSQIDNRIFPFTEHNARQMWNRLLEKAGTPYNEKDTQKALATPRYKMHIHTIRKFWFTTMKSTDGNKDHINTIGGHTSELSKAYERYPDKILKKTYDSYSDVLSIFSDLNKVNDKIDEKLGEQREIIASLQHRNTVLEQQMHLTREMMQTMAQQLEVLQNSSMNGGGK